MTGIDTTWLVDLEIIDSPRHDSAMELFCQFRSEQHSTLAVYHQIFLEFQHIVTDPKRFNSPLTVEESIKRCWFWIEQERIKVIYPSYDSLRIAQLWMNMYRLGRNRIQDTNMAAAYAQAGVSRIITANPKDFQIFQTFDLVPY